MSTVVAAVVAALSAVFGGVMPASPLPVDEINELAHSPPEPGTQSSMQPSAEHSTDAPSTGATGAPTEQHSTDEVLDLDSSSMGNPTAVPPPPAAAQRGEGCKEHQGSWLPLVDFTELPDWAKDNRLIISGYRQPDVLSTGQLWLSIFKIHNETGNIWSHLFGCVGCLVLGAVNAHELAQHRGIDVYDQLAFAAFFAGACTCFGMSTAFHTV